MTTVLSLSNKTRDDGGRGSKFFQNCVTSFTDDPYVKAHKNFGFSSRRQVGWRRQRQMEWVGGRADEPRDGHRDDVIKDQFGPRKSHRLLCAIP